MAPRSRTGCLTCRQRKLKCSEERPICAQCLKANRECIPSSGITFRHQQNPSMNGDPVARESLKSFYGYKETFTDQTVWVSIPRDLTFIHTNNPYEDEDGVMSDEIDITTTLLQDDDARQAELSLSQALYPSYATHGLEALSAVATQDQYHYAPQPPPPTATSIPHQELASGVNSVIQRDNLDFILTAQPLQSPNNLDPRLHTPSVSSQQGFASGQSPLNHAPPPHVRTLSYSSFSRPVSLLHKGNRQSPPIHDRELAFFLRDFSERAGHWMDIFDLDCFFGAHVPVLAVKSPLLVYSCAALSAKSLARVDGRKPTMNGQTSRYGRSKLEHWPGLAMSTEDWVRKGRENYDVAVSLLRQSLIEASKPRQPSLPSGVSPQAVVAASATQSGATSIPASLSNELLAATAILCVYEFLDASGLEWSRHLDGAKSLFDAAKDSMVPLVLPPSPMSIARQASQYLGDGLDWDASIATKRPSQGRVAVFWNFARQDMLAAFINSTRTRLDTNDLPMWQHAGLSLTLEGKVQPSNPQHADYDRDTAMHDDMVCNALIWLMSKLVNFIVSSEGALDAISPLGVDGRHQALVEDWNELNGQLQGWYDGLPESFHPSVVREAEDGFGVDETWFPRAMCGSTMQSYHFARIQLLHHKPPSVPSAAQRRNGSAAGLTLAARHAEYSTILQQTRAHAKEIVSIALGRADEGARVHAVQPLWTAGLVLGGNVDDDGTASAEAEMWRCTIVSLLRAIERDMGWAAEYRVQSLLELWNLPLDWHPESDFALG